MADHANAFLLLTILALVAILIVFGMKYFSGGRQARLRLAGENAYRQLAEQATRAQAAIASSLAAVQADLDEMKQKLAAVEKVLRQVE